MGKLTKEDIILFFLEDPYKLATEIWEGNVPKSDEIRILLCELGDPWCVYNYVEQVDRRPTDETRTVVCKSYAYWYASEIDKKPTDETRTAACKTPQCAYWYARDIDKKSTDETRTATCKDHGYAYCYAKDIDKEPTDETRESASKEPMFKDWYEQWEKECSLKKI